jgi:tRNA 2-thiouridine synthesizing protein E
MHAAADIKRWETSRPADPGFPTAPAEWTPREAETAAQADGLTLTEEHWEALRALQDYFARHDTEPGINMRELHDALEERFHARGGLKRLYQLFPGGPLAQGCRLAGLKAPFLATDHGFGSVA